jgi:hypothetical protein
MGSLPAKRAAGEAELPRPPAQKRGPTAHAAAEERGPTAHTRRFASDWSFDRRLRWSVLHSSLRVSARGQSTTVRGARVATVTASAVGGQFAPRQLASAVLLTGPLVSAGRSLRATRLRAARLSGPNGNRESHTLVGTAKRSPFPWQDGMSFGLNGPRSRRLSSTCDHVAGNDHDEATCAAARSGQPSGRSGFTVGRSPHISTPARGGQP